MAWCYYAAGSTWVPMSTSASGTALGSNPPGPLTALVGYNASSGQYYNVACDQNGNLTPSAAGVLAAINGQPITPSSVVTNATVVTNRQFDCGEYAGTGDLTACFNEAATYITTNNAGAGNSADIAVPQIPNNVPWTITPAVVAQPITAVATASAGSSIYTGTFSSGAQAACAAGDSFVVTGFPNISLTLSAAANASSSQTVYTGTITNGGSNALVGATIYISGFDTAANNGTFQVSASTTSTLTVWNPIGVSDTHAGTAVYQANNGSFPCTASSATTLTLSNVYGTAATVAASAMVPYQLISGMHILGVMPRLETPGSIGDPTDNMVANGGTWVTGQGMAIFGGNKVEGVRLENLGFTNFSTTMTFGGNSVSGLHDSVFRNLRLIGNSTVNSSDKGIEIYNGSFDNMDGVYIFNVNEGYRFVSQNANGYEPGNSVVTDLYVRPYAKSAANGNNTECAISLESVYAGSGTPGPVLYMDFNRPQVNGYSGDTTELDFCMLGTGSGGGTSPSNNTVTAGDFEGNTGVTGTWISYGTGNSISLASSYFVNLGPNAFSNTILAPIGSLASYVNYGNFNLFIGSGNIGGNLIFTGNSIFANGADSSLNIWLKPGLTADQTVNLNFQNRLGTTIWDVEDSPQFGSQFSIVDIQNSSPRFVATAGGYTTLNSYGANPLYFNDNLSGSGNGSTGGAEMRSGGAASAIEDSFYSTSANLGPSLNVYGNLTMSAVSTPTNATFSTASTGGTLTNSTTYYYRVAALNAVGTTLASAETSIATGSSGSNTNTVTAKWNTVIGAATYAVYGRSTGAELLMATISNNYTNSWVDTGSITPSGALPSANTTLGSMSGTSFGLASGIATLSAGAATISNANACTPSSTCVYKLTNCGLNGTAAVGIPGIGTVTPGTSFVIDSFTAIAGVSADTSKICWQIN